MAAWECWGGGGGMCGSVGVGEQAVWECWGGGGGLCGSVGVEVVG